MYFFYELLILNSIYLPWNIVRYSSRIHFELLTTINYSCFFVTIVFVPWWYSYGIKLLFILIE